MPLRAYRRLAAFTVAVLLFGAMALPLGLCLCSPADHHGGCRTMPGGEATVSCCCDGDVAVPTPNPPASTNIAANPLSVVIATPAVVSTTDAGTSAVDTPPAIALSRPLFKLFPAFLT